MRSLSKILLAVFAALFLCVGCAGKPIKLPSIPVEGIQKPDSATGRTISGSASGFQIFLFVPIGVNGRHDRAYSRLLEEAGDDRITDIKIQESWTYAFVGTIYKTTIEATAYPNNPG